MAVPPQLLMAAAQMLKNRKSPKNQIKEALAPATDVLKNDIAPLVGMGADAGMMYNLRAEDPSMRTGIATGAIGSAAKGFQDNGITGLITGGIMGGVTGAIATGNAKEQKAEQDKYTYLNQMYSSVVGADTNLQSALMYAKDGGEIVSADGETFVPIQTEAKKIGKKLVKEKFIFSDGKIADVNATKPHSEQKKDDVTDIVVEGAYVMPVSTKLNKKDLDSLVSYSTSNYSENGKNFAVEKVTLRDILGEKFEGSFAEATDIVTKKYPVMDTEDDLDPIARITNNENIANRSKIIAHLMRLNEAKINKEPIEEVKLTPSMKAKTGGYVHKYVLGSTVAGYPPGKRKMNINEFPFLERVGMTPAEATARSFHEDSLNSVGYKKRIIKAAPPEYTDSQKEKYANDQINKRKQSLRETKNIGIGVSKDNYNAQFSYDEKGNKTIGFKNDFINDPGVNTHELSHATTNGMNGFIYYDAMKIDDKVIPYNENAAAKKMSGEEYNNKSNPTEFKARLDVLKQYAGKKGIIKIGEDISIEKIDNLFNVLYNDNSDEAKSVRNQSEDLYFILKEDKDNSKIDNLRLLWNEIADSNGKMKPQMVAKTGGYVQKYVLGSTVSGDPTKPKTALEKRKEKYDQNKPKPVNRYTLKTYEPESKAKQIYKKLVAPVSAMDNRPDTSYEDPSGLDVALGVLNPFAWVDGAATVLKSTKDIVTGEGQGNDYATVGVSAAGAALGLRGSKAKGIGDKISKFMNNMYNPAAGVSLKKVDVPTPTNNIETPEGFQNRVFDSNVQLGQYSGKGHLSEAGYNYRVLSPAEIDAIAETRGVFPRVGKQKGGNENTKYWTKGNEKNWYGDKANLETIRVKQDRFTNDKVVLADDVEVFNKQTGKFEPLSAIKPTPKMTKGGFVSKYVLKPAMSLMKGGYIRKMAAGGGVSDPPGKKYKSAKGTIIVGEDGKYYFGKQDGSYIEANPQTVDMFTKQLAASKNPSGGENPWLLVEGTKGKPVLSANPAPQQPRPEVTVANDLDPSLRDTNPIYSEEPIDILGNSLNPSGTLVPRKKLNIPALPNRTNPVLRSMNTPAISSLMPTDVNSITDQMMTPSDTEPIDQFRDVIAERKGDAVRDAEEAKTGYNALSRRVGMRDLMQLGTGLVGIGLQDRTERRAFKRPLFMDQKYRGLSPQQINQQAEAGTGAGVEAIKQMMNGGGDRVTARLAPVLIDRLISQQGATRKAYVDQNTQLERAKYGELGAIQQANLDEEARAKNVERDFNNKAIAGSTSLINKYISSTSAGDIEGYKAMKDIEESKIRKIYDLENQEMQVGMIDKEYEMQMSDIRQKITDMEAQLMDPNMTFDEASKKSLEFSIARDKENLKNLEERQKKSKIRQNINGQ